MIEPPDHKTLTRRQFLTRSAAGVAAAGLFRPGSAGRVLGASEEPFSFGLVTDVHYADMPARGSRHYRDSLQKLSQAVELFNRRKLSFVVELGDLVDAGSSKADDLEYLQVIRKVFEACRTRRHYVLGNHCLARLTKAEFLANCGASVKRSYYSFDCGRYHFVVLDGNFKRDGSPYAAGNFSWTDTWIPNEQKQWLAKDLQKAQKRKTIVFIHQNLHNEEDAHGVKNAPQIRAVLQRAGNVLAVFQGHMHTGGYAKIEAIHYCTLKAMVEGPGPQSNAFAVVTLDGTDSIKVEGLGLQKSMSIGGRTTS